MACGCAELKLPRWGGVRGSAGDELPQGQNQDAPGAAAKAQDAVGRACAKEKDAAAVTGGAAGNV